MLILKTTRYKATISLNRFLKNDSTALILESDCESYGEEMCLQLLNGSSSWNETLGKHFPVVTSNFSGIWRMRKYFPRANYSKSCDHAIFSVDNESMTSRLNVYHRVLLILVIIMLLLCYIKCQEIKYTPL